MDNKHQQVASGWEVLSIEYAWLYGGGAPTYIYQQCIL